MPRRQSKYPISEMRLVFQKVNTYRLDSSGMAIIFSLCSVSVILPWRKTLTTPFSVSVWFRKMVSRKKSTPNSTFEEKKAIFLASSLVRAADPSATPAASLCRSFSPVIARRILRLGQKRANLVER